MKFFSLSSHFLNKVAVLFYLIVKCGPVKEGLKPFPQLLNSKDKRV
jgi:hypothetical protein